MLKEIDHLQFHINSLQKESTYLSQNIEQLNTVNSKSASETKKIQTQKEAIIANLTADLEKEKNGQFELNVQASQLKAKLSDFNQSTAQLTEEIIILKEKRDNDRTALAKAQEENTRLRQRWADITSQLENEKSGKVTTAREVQDLRKQLKQLDILQATCNELTIKKDKLEVQLKEETLLCSDTEIAYQQLQQRYQELDKKRQQFENLGVFSGALMETVPIFTQKAVEIDKKLSSHVTQQTEDTTTQSPSLIELKKQIQLELQNQTTYLESVLSSLKMNVVVNQE
eukprot:TRINITY_DN934_c0_g1_i4.p1 TRINITY_DN934_c0_g1~~TRINITY_DN934_c0_g1_i4.p1  ORF type:complete len:285 (+),score=73.51 TRINITY_DN934_c0_g1_i4:281-1135(+)